MHAIFSLKTMRLCIIIVLLGAGLLVIFRHDPLPALNHMMFSLWASYYFLVLYSITRKNKQASESAISAFCIVKLLFV